jgi:hypothetical protein
MDTSIHRVVKITTTSHKLGGSESESDTFVRDFVITAREFTWDEDNNKVYYDHDYKLTLFSKDGHEDIDLTVGSYDG